MLNIYRKTKQNFLDNITLSLSVIVCFAVIFNFHLGLISKEKLDFESLKMLAQLALFFTASFYFIISLINRWLFKHTNWIFESKTELSFFFGIILIYGTFGFTLIYGWNIKFEKFYTSIISLNPYLAWIMVILNLNQFVLKNEID